MEDKITIKQLNDRLNIVVGNPKVNETFDELPNLNNLSAAIEIESLLKGSNETLIELEKFILENHEKCIQLDIAYNTENYYIMNNNAYYMNEDQWSNVIKIISNCKNLDTLKHSLRRMPSIIKQIDKELLLTIEQTISNISSDNRESLKNYIIKKVPENILKDILKKVLNDFTIRYYLEDKEIRVFGISENLGALIGNYYFKTNIILKPYGEWVSRPSSRKKSNLYSKEENKELNIITLNKLKTIFYNISTIHILMIMESDPSDLIKTNLSTINVFSFFKELNKRLIILSGSCFGLLQHKYCHYFPNNTIFITISDYYCNTLGYEDLYKYSQNDFTGFSNTLYHYYNNKYRPTSVVYISYINNTIKIKTLPCFFGDFNPNFIYDLYLGNYSNDKDLKLLVNYYDCPESLLLKDSLQQTYIIIAKKQIYYKAIVKSDKNLYRRPYDVVNDIYLLQTNEEKTIYFKNLFRQYPCCYNSFATVTLEKEIYPYYYKQLLEYISKIDITIF